MGIFDFFRSKKGKKQKEPNWISTLPKEIAEKMLKEIKSNPQACKADQIPQGKGKFGHEKTNPIPTYGIPSNEAYLNSLRNKKGERLRWRRNQSIKVSNIEKPIDHYEIFNWEGNLVANLYLSPYHWKTSEIPPHGYKIVLSDRNKNHPSFSEKVDKKYTVKQNYPNKTQDNYKNKKERFDSKREKIKTIFGDNFKKEKVTLENNSVTLYYLEHYHPYRSGNNLNFNTFSSNILNFKKGSIESIEYFYQQINNAFKKIKRNTNLLRVPSHSPNKNSQIEELIKRLIKVNPDYLHDCSRSLNRHKKINSLSKSNGKREIKTHLDSISLSTSSALTNNKYENIILDDVCTTGSSIIACSKILKRKGVDNIHHFCLARTFFYNESTFSSEFSDSDENFEDIDDDLPF